MIGKRYIDGDKLLDRLREESGRMHSMVPVNVEAWLRLQPRLPKLVGRQRAAEILKVSSPYISILAREGVMPKPIPVEGGKDAYIEFEVKALAKQRDTAKTKEKT